MRHFEAIIFLILAFNVFILVYAAGLYQFIKRRNSR